MALRSHFAQSHDQPEEKRREQADAIVKADTLVMDTGKTLTVEEPLVLPNGGTAIFLSKKIPLRNKKGDVIGLLGVSFDITDRKQAEEREQIALTKAKAEEETRQAVMILASSMAHDMRAPLTTLNLLSSKISDTLPTLIETYQSAVRARLPLTKELTPSEIQTLSGLPHVINNAVIEMNGFANDSLSAITRVLTDQITTQDLVTCSMEYCVHNALHRYPFASDEWDLIHWDKSYNFEFKGNPILFFRIIFNLIENALYHIQQHGRGSIFLSAVDGGNVNIFKVKNTAGGLPDDKIENIFGAFKSANTNIGSGIGLAFCKLTMQRFGGDITCHGVEGEYLEFELRFPKK